MAEIISYPEKSILSENDYLLISDSQNSYITKKTKVSDINALAPANTGINGSGTANYIPKFVSTKVIGDSIIYNGTDTISIGAETNIAESRLNVYKTSDMTTAAPHVATFNEASSDHSASLWPGSGNNSADIYGSVSRSTFTGSGTLDQLMGANPVSRHSGSGTVQFVQGVQTTASLQGDGTAEFIYATYSKANINGTANTTVDAALGGWHVAELNGENNVDDIYGTISNVMLTKGTVNTSAVAHLLDFDQVPADTTVSNVYYIKAENDNLTATGEKFFIKEETGLPSQFSNKLILDSYGSGTYTGTATQRLAVDTNGNVIEIPIGSGPVDGSGTANYTARWIDTDTLGIGALYDDGTNIGIGTASPSEKLEVAGYAKASTGFKAGNYTILSESGNETSLSNSAYYPMFFKTNNSVRMTISNAGNIGIGTTSPTQKLEVAGNALINNSGDGRLYLGSTSDYVGNIGSDLYVYSSGQNIFYSGGSEQMRIKTNGNVLIPNGNVGIGTTSPSTKLEVITTANEDGIAIKDTSGNLKYKVRQFNGNSYSSFWNASNQEQVRISTSSTTYFNGGNVGIGTTSPSYNLEVRGTADQSLYLAKTGTTYLRATAGANAELFTGGSMVLGSGNTERIRIVSTGNVGIGTTSPAGTLHVVGPTGGQGSIYVSDIDNGAGAGDSLLITKSGTNAFIYNRDGGQLSFGSNNQSSNLTINSNGNVGIGTTSPLGRLQVNEYTVGSQGNQNVHGELSVFANSGDESLFLGIRDAVYPDRGWAFNPVANGVNSDLQIKEHGASGVRMTLQSAGNVGIGTTSPVSTLDISKDTASLLNLHRPNSSAAAASFLDFSFNTANGTEAVYSRIRSDVDTSTDSAQSGDLSFYNASSGSIVERMRITSTGNVGIGTTSPENFGSGSHLLTVQSASGGGYGGFIAKTTNVTGQLWANQVGSNVFIGSRTNHPLIFTVNNVEKARINTSGNVGIGTTSPLGKLHITDSISAVLKVQETSGNTGTSAGVLFKTSPNTVDSYFKGGVLYEDTGDPNVIGKLHLVNRISADSSNANVGDAKLTIDTSGNVGIGTTSPQAKLDISTTGTGDSMIIRNDDASSSAAPVLMLLRDSASAANGDYLGQIKFKGNSDTGAERVYAKITAKISDATNGAEDSLIETAVRDNGSNLIVSRQTHQNLKLINGTGLESDGDIYMPVVGKGLIIKSPDGTRYRITVDNSGNLGTELA